MDGLRPAQRRAVEAPGGVAVVAGAGTGKTHMLAHRYLKHVRDGLDPLEIVAVTFTERAAAELRSRIRALLHAGLPSGSPARLTVEAAQISTMHALAQRICREFPEQAGVAPDFTILDDLEGGMWLTERIESALATVPGELFEAVPYQSVKSALSALLDDPITADAAFANPPGEWPALVKSTRAAALAAMTGAAGWREAVDIVRTTVGTEGDRRETTRREAVRSLARLSRGDVTAGLTGLAALGLVGGSKKAFPDGDFAVLGEALKFLRQSAREALAAGLVDLELGEADERMAELLPQLRGAYRGVRERLESEKRARRVLDFSDLEVHALRALADAEVVAHYQSRWRALLVDEFQDTNAVQEKILAVLAGSTTVTVVGDEKQSIYGFRGAKSEVFRRYRRSVAAHGGAEVVLWESFRSHAGLIDDLNGIFAPLLAEQHQELTAVRSTTPGVGPFTTLTVVAGAGAKAGRQLSEARALGTAIKRLVDEGTLVHDKSTEELRPVRFGDVAVLARGWQALGVYGEVLPALGVPAIHTGGGNLLAMREAKDGANLLRALTEPTDDVALVALLRSPFFAVDDITLYRLATQRGAAQSARADPYAGVSYWETLRASPDLDGVLARARDVIADLLTRRGSLPPSGLLLAADSLTGHSAALAGLPGGRRRLADYGGFLDLVRRLEVGSEDLFTVWRRLRRLLAADVEVGRPNLAAEGAVTLLTIHSSKGLEWPVVAVADLERRRPTRLPPVLIDEDIGVALRLEDEEGEAVEPALYRILRARATVREEQEVHRLLYVALTRARDHLILSAAAERGGALDILDPGLRAAGVARQTAAHDPNLAGYPAQPRQAEPLVDAVLDAAAMRMVAPTVGWHDGPGAPGSGSVATPDGTADAWSATLDLVATLDDTWLPVTEALVEAGVRPPATELAGRWLTVDADLGAVPTRPLPSPTYLLLAWRVPGGLLAVIDAAPRAGQAGGAVLPVTGRSVTAESSDCIDYGTMTIARLPRGSSPGDEVARAWLLPLDPLIPPAAAVERIRSALSAVDDKAAG